MKISFCIILLSLSTVTSVAIADNITPHPSPQTNSSVPPPSTISLSASEWQELRSARMAALKNNPALLGKASQLKEKIAAFDQKLHSAMLKTDPTIAPILAKFSGDWGQSTHAVAPLPPASNH